MWPQSALDVLRTFVSHGGLLPKCVSQSSEPLIGIETDSRLCKKNTLFLAIKGEKHNGHDHIQDALNAGSLAAVVEEQWYNNVKDHGALLPYLCPVPNVTEAFRLWASEARKSLNIPVVAVGGSSGKTTTKELLASCLSVHFSSVHKTFKSQNGFLGIPMTFAHMPPDAEAMVVEIGIDTLDTMAEHVRLVKPDIALLTALGPEHLEGLKTWENARSEELKLFLNAPLHAVRIWACQDPHIKSAAETHARSHDVAVIPQVLAKREPGLVALFESRGLAVFTYEYQKSLHYKYWGFGHPAFLNHKFQSHKKGSPYTDASATEGETLLPLSGEHNAGNLALALATAFVLGASPREVNAGLKTFSPPSQRAQILSLPYGTTLIDDTYNANPASMNASFSLLNEEEFKDQKKALFLGDMRELGEESKTWHVSLAEGILKLGKCSVWLYGDEMSHLYDHLSQHLRSLSAGSEVVVMQHLPSAADPRQFLSQPWAHDMIKGAVVLVKGSRGMAMERLTERVKELVSFCRG